MSRQFPEGFVYGGATAAYQVEGETRTHGKGKVPWDDFLAAVDFRSQPNTLSK